MPLSIRFYLPFAALFLSISSTAAVADYDGSPQEKAKWVEFCVNSLNSGKDRPGARLIYCQCMSEVVDTADFRRLYEWERMFPPAHQSCYDEAGFEPGG